MTEGRKPIVTIVNIIPSLTASRKYFIILYIDHLHVTSMVIVSLVSFSLSLFPLANQR